MTATVANAPRIAVFCGAADPADPIHLQAAAAAGRLLAVRGIHVVFGGGRLGLMGQLADAALAAGGTVTGILPAALNSPDIAHPGLTSLEIVQDTATRKARLVDLADAVLALPGGLGTLDELAHVWAGDAYTAGPPPVGLLNTSGFYTPLLDFLRRTAAGGFFGHHGLRVDDLAVVDDNPTRLVHTLIARIHRPAPRRRTPATHRASTS
ncbi:TIGR00730 family Rossman fold protein [Streptomyces sp. NPDC020681]|uniref:TIGR00730 family Rossman fold protein n=1 Tax=Streptomyces sp. NPDC020681 TaxID=3365083 RepID=UPI00378BED79